MEVDEVKIFAASLVVAHVIWALSLLMEPERYVFKPLIPPVFALFHLAAAVLFIAEQNRHAAAATMVLLTYYWLFVKPVEPIAEPQSVGIIGVTAVFLAGLLPQRFNNFSAKALDGLFRLGLAYPFFEWGVDAFRNPVHFITYLSVNQVTRRILPSAFLDEITFFLGAYEVFLGLWILSGLLRKYAMIFVIATLAVFTVVAGYPLAFPQNIVLVAAAYTWLRKGDSIFSS